MRTITATNKSNSSRPVVPSNDVGLRPEMLILTAFYGKMRKLRIYV